jgi:type IV pilus assembly protein PilC
MPLKRYPKHFDQLFVNMITAGEAGGILDIILKRWPLYGKGGPAQAQSQGRHGLSRHYHFVAVVVVAVILVFVIPVFQEMFSDFGSTLPGPDPHRHRHERFRQIEDPLHDRRLVIFFVAFKKYYKTDKGRLTVDAIMLKLPVFGMLLRKVAVAKFTRTMGTMLSSGVAISGSARYRGQNRRQPHHRKSHLFRALRYFRRPHHGRSLAGERRFSCDGLPDDRRR